jgi:hypothetical protein
MKAGKIVQLGKSSSSVYGEVWLFLRHYPLTDILVLE